MRLLNADLSRSNEGMDHGSAQFHRQSCGDQRSSAGVRIAQTEGQDQSVVFVRQNRELLILSLNKCHGIPLGIMSIFRLACQRVSLSQARNSNLGVLQPCEILVMRCSEWR
jgi:hypothetical protein